MTPVNSQVLVLVASVRESPHCLEAQAPSRLNTQQGEVRYEGLSTKTFCSFFSPIPLQSTGPFIFIQDVPGPPLSPCTTWIDLQTLNCSFSWSPSSWERQSFFLPSCILSPSTYSNSRSELLVSTLKLTSPYSTLWSRAVSVSWQRRSTGSSPDPRTRPPLYITII